MSLLDQSLIDSAAALSSVAGIRSLTLDGETLNADVASALTAASIELTIEGASTLSLSIHDANLKILRSGLFSQRLTAQVDFLSFELVKVAKSGFDLTLTFEDLAVAALRRHSDPRKVEAGTMTHVDFAKLLVGEEPWIGFRTFAGLAEKSKVELTRGKVASETAQEKTGEEFKETEDTWTCLGRLVDERGWRRFMRDGELWYIPESFLFLGDPIWFWSELSRTGVDTIDFDYDVGQPGATAEIAARSGRWDVRMGDIAQLSGVGPADGKWLVSSLSRSLFEVGVSITVSQPIPTLPEPDQSDVSTPDPGSLDNEDIGFGGPGEGLNVAAVKERDVPWTGNVGLDTAWMWPVSGRVSSGFGQRSATAASPAEFHAGIDIACPIGTEVHAAREGTVTLAGPAAGYGLAVYIDHGGYISRYGHLSEIMSTRGLKVRRGDVIALSGNTGHSTGPHCHFEIRTGPSPGSPTDPMKFLPPSGTAGISVNRRQTIS